MLLYVFSSFGNCLQRLIWKNPTKVRTKIKILASWWSVDKTKKGRLMSGGGVGKMKLWEGLDRTMRLVIAGVGTACGVTRYMTGQFFTITGRV
jgi:hypothetical protein